jgi:subtilisin family serine protease
MRNKQVVFPKHFLKKIALAGVLVTYCLAILWLLVNKSNSVDKLFSSHHKLDMQDRGSNDRGIIASPFKNWGLFNSKHYDQEDFSDIDAIRGWKIEEGSRDVVVAVIDTGVDATNKDLKDNLWHDPESPNEMIYGWSFVNNKPNPIDSHGHGTHVAGIIGAIADVENGMSGVAHKVSIMSVKYYSESNPGSINLRNTILALDYAIDHGANIINYSGGGPEFSEDEFLAMKRAAGNEHQDTDQTYNYYYPAAYRLSNTIAVASSDINNNLLPSSNWGKTHVDVAAPGENIYSTLPGGRYGYMTGTSQATAFVSGIAALLLSHDRSLTAVEMKDIIMETVDRYPQLESKIVTGGRVNLNKALLEVEKRQRQHRDLANQPKPDSTTIADPTITDLLTKEGYK